MSRITPSRAADLSNDEEKHRQPLHSSKLPEWPTLTERTSVLGIRILLFIHRHCGALPFRIVLRMVNAVYWLTSPRLRAVVCDYQRRVDQAAPFLLKYFGTSAPSARSGLAQLERFSLAILEKFCALSGEDHLAALDVSGDEPFRKDAPKAGCVILTSHTGCQELLSQASPACSIPGMPDGLMSSSNEPAHGRRKSNSLKSALRFRPRSSWSSRTVRPKEPILFWRATARRWDPRLPKPSRSLAVLPAFLRAAHCSPTCLACRFA